MRPNNDDDRRALLILGAADMQRRAYEEARKLSLKTIGVDPDSSACCHTLADQFYAVDLRDEEHLIEIARLCGVRGVMTLAADYPMRALAGIAAALNLPGPGPAVVERVTNKHSMIEHATRQGLATPRWLVAADVAEAAEAIAQLGGEAVLKPLDSSGSKGVSFVQLSPENEALQTAVAEARGISRCSLMLIEEYVPGPEYSIEVLVAGDRIHIIGITRKKSSGIPHFVEIGHGFPAPLEPRMKTTIDTFVSDAVRAFGLRDCAAHVELKLRDGHPVLIELAARLGGGYINTELVPAATGINLVRETIRVALGEPADVTPVRAAGAAVRFILPAPGRIRSVCGVDELRRMPGLIMLVCPYQEGDVVPVIKDSRNRVAYLIFEGRDTQEAEARADLALETLYIESG